jgi:iron complex transport system substrate-binding protein
MKENFTNQIKLAFLFLVAVIAVTMFACSGSSTQVNENKNDSTALQLSVATKVVNHAFGQIEIPLHPQRVVVLDGNITLDPMLALGVKPVGSAPCLVCILDNSLDALAADIPVVGDVMQPSLEKILSLKPDLILAHQWHESIYPKLSAIDLKRELRYVAQIFDKSEEAEKVLSEYDDRIQQFQKKLGTKLRDKTVSIIHLYGSQISACGSGVTTYGQVMSDAGLQLIQAYKDLKNSCTSISLETLPEWDADILFLVVIYEKHEDLMSLSFLKQPIWSTLKAVQNKQTYAVNWASVGGPIGANWLIDELYKYFADAP